MIMSPTSDMFAVFLILFINYANPAAIPEKERQNNEVWTDDDYNLVEPPPSITLFFSNVFDHSKSKVTPQERLKSVIKAIYQYDTMNNPHKNNNNYDFAKSSVYDTTLKPNEDKSTSVSSNEEQKIFSSSNEEQEQIQKVDDIDEKEDIDTPIEGEEIDLETTTPSDVTPTEQTTQKSGLLLEDLVDSIVRIPAHMESDKTQKYTHSIRYGYDVPFHYKGL
ncbi:uncharacterized protein LOC142328411 [Lycorma delicatula]|uniref:uncharacterized protein LOC142328411 n=1 Tax=Lycorma delicatula TaxID=130591 RepID=UPI003F51AA5B